MDSNGIVGINVEIDGNMWEATAFPVDVTAVRIGEIVANYVSAAAACDQRVTRIEFIYGAEES